MLGVLDGPRIKFDMDGCGWIWIDVDGYGWIRMDYLN